MATTYITRFVVVAPAHRRFPLDMLRYDACFPASQEAVSNLIDTMFGGPSERTLALQGHIEVPAQRVELARYHSGKEPRITEGRWQSFGWEVGWLNTSERFQTRKV